MLSHQAALPHLLSPAESVEVITNPTAAYNANGGAIVNIVLKRNRKAGAHAQIRASAANEGLWNAGASGRCDAKRSQRAGQPGGAPRWHARRVYVRVVKRFG